MSHRADTSGVPYISSISPSAVSVAGSQQIVVTGNALSPSTEVDIGSLGVITGKAFAHVTSVSQTLTLTVTVAAIPDPSEEVDITCSNGGISGNSKPVWHGWAPPAVAGLSLWLDATDASTISDGEYFDPDSAVTCATANCTDLASCDVGEFRSGCGGFSLSSVLPSPLPHNSSPVAPTSPEQRETAAEECLGIALRQWLRKEQSKGEEKN